MIGYVLMVAAVVLSMSGCVDCPSCGKPAQVPDPPVEHASSAVTQIASMGSCFLYRVRVKVDGDVYWSVCSSASSSSSVAVR